MSLRVNKALNLVVPVESDAGTIYVHSTPLRREVFEKYFLVISKTFSAIYSEGLSVISGPRIALLMLRKIAVDAGVWDGVGGVENGLLNEIRRISNVLVPTESGWALRPFQDVLSSGLLSEDEIDEVEGTIVFFICASAIHRKADLGRMLDHLQELWGTQTTLLNCTEFKSSLPTLTAPETTPETVKQSSIPC